MRYTWLILPALLGLLAASCSSPLDVDTPRNRDLDSLQASTTVRASTIAMKVQQFNSIGTMDFTMSGTAIIDTGKAPPVLWLTATGTAPSGTENQMPLREVTMHLDSIVAGSSPISIVGTPSDKMGADVAVVQITGLPRHFNPDGASTTFVITFTLDRANRQLTGAFTTDTHPGGTSVPMSGTLTLGY